MIGNLAPERLQFIPDRFKEHHEYCFYIHDAMVSLLKEAEKLSLSTVKIKLEDDADAAALKESNDPINYFYETGRRDISRRIALNQVAMALFADFLHFVHEALTCLERRKMTVAFALLRKPLQQNLLFAAWMLAEEEIFFEQMRKSPADYMEEKHLPREKRIELFEASLRAIEHHGLLDGALINDLIYEKEKAKGFAHLFAKANHLVTSRGKLARTEALNLNFIFKNPNDNDVYENVYLGLSYILFFALLLQIALFSRMKVIEKSFTEWVTLACMGAFSALFVPGRQHLALSLEKSLKNFLICPHCKSKIKIKKLLAARFFLTENLFCTNCGNDHHFPLFWLLSQTQWSVTGEIKT